MNIQTVIVPNGTAEWFQEVYDWAYSNSIDLANAAKHGKTKPTNINWRHQIPLNPSSWHRDPTAWLLWLCIPHWSRTKHAKYHRSMTLRHEWNMINLSSCATLATSSTDKGQSKNIKEPAHMACPDIVLEPIRGNTAASIRQHKNVGPNRPTNKPHIWIFLI